MRIGNIWTIELIGICYIAVEVWQNFIGGNEFLLRSKDKVSLATNIFMSCDKLDAKQWGPM